MEKYRNLTYLEHLLEEVNRTEQNKFEVSVYHNLVPRACDPREGMRGSVIIRCRKPGILAKTELRIPYQRPIRFLPETDYPRASRSFPRIAGSGNEIVFITNILWVGPRSDFGGNSGGGGNKFRRGAAVKQCRFCPSLQLLQSFFQNIALKGYLTQR